MSVAAPNRIRWNIAANFAGRGWVVILSLAAVPVYLSGLGAETYGLIGFFTGIQAVLALLDLGIGASLARELARNVVVEESVAAQDTARTLEWIYWLIGIAAGMALIASSAFVAESWLKPDELTPEMVRRNLVYMTVAIVLQWPSGLYSSGLIGLQRQVALNVASILTSSLRIGGSILVITLISPTPEAFFLWQILAAIVQTVLLRHLLWRELRGGTCQETPRFRAEVLRRHWRLAARLSATSLMTISLAQLDKIILSTLLPLRMFGFYALASTMAQSLNLLQAPVSDALFPKYAQLVARNDQEEMRRLFLKGTQIIAVLIIPLAAVLGVLSEEVLKAWINDAEVASSTHVIASLLVAGVAINAVTSTLDLLQLAYGWLKPSFYTRLVSLILMGPLMWYLAFKYGAIGAAIAWVVVYSCALLIMPSFVFRRLMQGGKWRWYERVGTVAAISLGAAFVARLIVPELSRIQSIFFLIATWISAVGGCVLLIPSLRHLGCAFLSQTIAHRSRP